MSIISLFRHLPIKIWRRQSSGRQFRPSIFLQTPQATTAAFAYFFLKIACSLTSRPLNGLRSLASNLYSISKKGFLLFFYFFLSVSICACSPWAECLRGINLWFSSFSYYRPQFIPFSSSSFHRILIFYFLSVCCCQDYVLRGNFHIAYFIRQFRNFSYKLNSVINIFYN